MTAPQITSAHYIRARYLGPTDYKPARYSITWEGWPSDDSRPVRRIVPWQDVDKLAETVARIFCEWISSPAFDGDTPSTYTPRSIIYASAAPDEWAFMVQTRDSREG